MKKYVIGILLTAIIAWQLSSQEAQNTQKPSKTPVLSKRITNNKSTKKTSSQVNSNALEKNIVKAEELIKKDFNKETQERLIQNLVQEGANFLKSHTIQEACSAFSHTKDFIRGSAYIFVMDEKGQFWAHGDQEELIYTNMYEQKDNFGVYFIKDMIKTAQTGGWVTYSWRNAIKKSYVTHVKKENATYIIGAGYYPHTKEDVVIGMVKAAVNLFNKTKDQGYGVSEPFSSINYPLQDGFSIGDLYLYALDFKGKIYAQADRPGLVGTNSWGYKDSQGKLVNQEIIQKLQNITNENDGVWVTYVSKGTNKKAYAQRVTDKEGNHYFIACGYYPDVNRKEVETLVARAGQYLEGHGKSVAISAFSNKRDDTYRLGDLYLIVYDTQGKVISHGSNDELIGKNMWDDKDENGHLYVQEIITKAKAGGGWVDYRTKGSFQSTFVELIDLGIEQLVVCSGLFPISKRETMMLLVKSALTALKSGDKEAVLHSFVDKDGTFIRGDLKIFTFDTDGICYAWGDNHALIWKNILNWHDEKNFPFIKAMIDESRNGPTNIAYTFNQRNAIAYVERLEKDGKIYIIGSSFYY